MKGRCQFPRKHIVREDKNMRKRKCLMFHTLLDKYNGNIFFKIRLGRQ